LLSLCPARNPRAIIAAGQNWFLEIRTNHRGDVDELVDELVDEPDPPVRLPSEIEVCK